MLNPNKEHQLRDCLVVRMEKNMIGHTVTIKHKTTLIQDVFYGHEVVGINVGDKVTGYVKFSILADRYVLRKINKRK